MAGRLQEVDAGPAVAQGLGFVGDLPHRLAVGCEEIDKALRNHRGVLPVIVVWHEFGDGQNGVVTRRGEQRFGRALVKVQQVKGGRGGESAGAGGIGQVAEAVAATGEVAGKSLRPEAADAATGGNIVANQPSVSGPVVPESVRGGVPPDRAGGVGLGPHAITSEFILAHPNGNRFRRLPVEVGLLDPAPGFRIYEWLAFEVSDLRRDPWALGHLDDSAILRHGIIGPRHRVSPSREEVA